MKKIIGISGWKRSGKDTAAEFLIAEHGYKKVSFADPLKVMVAEEYGIPLSWCYDQDKKEAPISSLPVTPKDKFTESIAGLLYNEFKTAKGESLKADSIATGDAFWTPRALCILKGSTNRSVDSQYWVKRAIDKIKNSEHDKFVISDFRYRSEMEQFKEAFNGSSTFTNIRINRFASVDTTDPSERDLDNYEFDFVVENKTTLENLYKTVGGIVAGS